MNVYKTNKYCKINKLFFFQNVFKIFDNFKLNYNTEYHI